MPLVHGLAVLFPYFKYKSRVDPLALVASATIVDLEPLYYILIGQEWDHRMWHGYALTLTVYAVLVGLAVYLAERFLERRLWSTYTVLGFKPTRVRYSPLTIYLCCLAGGFSHIFFDMFTHRFMPYVVYPLTYGNPFYLGGARGIVEVAAVALAFYSLFCWWKSWKQSRNTGGRVA